MVPDEFERLVAEYYEPLYRFAYSLTRVRADAYDLTQQTFYVWATKGHQIRERSKTKAWLFTTLHRNFLESRRKQTRFPHQGLDEIAFSDIPTVSRDLGNEADSPEVLSALSKVEKVYQAAVALFYLEDCSYREIAQILEVAEGTVKSRIARGIAQLRQLMGHAVSPRSSKSDPLTSTDIIYAE
jgi:RNA polymerase sigma-70 factor (ECF subfamily)